MSSSGDVTIKILFFAKAKEFTKKSEAFVKISRKIEGKNLLEIISEKYNLGELKCNFMLALNENWIDINSEILLEDDDEVAVIPPLSGVIIKHKMNWVQLTTNKLSIETIYNLVCSPDFGAVSLFIGTTRSKFEGKTVCRLEYEAYEGMAVKSLENICQNIRKKFDVGNIAIFHRLGDVSIQEISVIIAISSTHRQSSLEAVPFAINSLKADVPIWKKEVYEDGKTSEWKENSECEWSGN